LSVCGQITNNDCVKSRVLCGDGSFTADNLGGPGFNDFANPANQDGCLAGAEKQSAWYVFTIKKSGDLAFDIVPFANDDFDFAVYGPNKLCDALGVPIACNVATPVGLSGNTGLGTGIPTSGYSPVLPVLEGETYYLLIDNFSNTNNGFAFFLKGDAELDDNNVGNALEFMNDVSCNVVRFNNVATLCGAIFSFNWDFGDGSPPSPETTKSNPTHIYSSAGTFMVTHKLTVVASSNPLDVGTVLTYQRPITITFAPPPVQITNLNDSYCINTPKIQLTGQPSGGTFAIRKNQEGEFINNQNFFDPAVLGVGTHEVRYTRNDAVPKCVSRTSKLVTVHPLPTLRLDQIQSGYCRGTAPIPLIGDPEGGTFFVEGVPVTVLDPAQWALGLRTIGYFYEDPQTLCSNFIFKTFTIEDSTFINIKFLNLQPTYCEGSNPFFILGSPAGGVYSINGVNGQLFNPATLGVGTHTIKYVYTSPVGCKRTLIQKVDITPKPVITTNLKPSYCVNEPVIALQGVPSGGIFRVNGIMTAQFNPATLGVGNHTVRYDYFNPINPSCFNTWQQTIPVYKLPTAVLSGVNDTYCELENITVQPIITITLADNTIKVETPNNLSFNPSLLGVGSHTLTYNAVDTNTGCGVLVTKTFRVLPSPFPLFIDLKDTYCEQAFPITLQASIAGGIFKINNVIKTIFLPAEFSAGAVVQVSYELTNNQGCGNKITKEIRILPTPYNTTQTATRLCPNPDTPFMMEALTEDEEANLQGQGINIIYDWNRTNDNIRILSVVSSADSGRFEVLVRTLEGCVLSKKIFDLQLDCEAKFFVPTAFTPNGDNKNPTLKIFGEFLTKLDFRIYNRWGEVVFATTRKDDEWNGTVNGSSAPAGVYIWQVTYQNSLKRGATFKKSGQITLIR
jgi:gliding motility-associated-like protein